MDFKDTGTVLAGMCGLFAGAAVAIEPAPINVGNFTVVPQLTVTESYDDNIFSEETGEKDSFVTVIQPSVSLIAEGSKSGYRLTYGISRGEYASVHTNDYTDQNLLGEAVYRFDARNTLNLQLQKQKLHEDGGSDVSKASGANKPLRYHVNSARGQYQFGAPEAQGRLDLQVSYDDRAYDNFRATTSGRDRENLRLDGTFYYRIAPKTSALVEIRHEDVDYTSKTSTLDSTEIKYLAGLTWDATAKTSGTAKIGYGEKNFDSAARSDFDSSTWEIAVTWAPKPYSTFILTTGQEAEESSGTGNLIDTNTFNVGWNHAWNERLSSMVNVGRTSEDYVKAIREDDTDNLSLGLNYEMKRWLSMGINYTYSDRDSNVAGSSFSRNIWMLTVNASL